MTEAGPAVRRTAFEFPLRDDDVLRGDAWTPSDKRRSDTVIVVCHGFKGFKDWGFFPYLCGQLAEMTGFATVGFNFAGSGVGSDLANFTELDKFGHNTFSKELEDLAEVLQRLRSGELADDVEPASRFGIFGHSRGGAAALITAFENEDVGAVATWAAISSVERYETAFGEELESEGVVYIANARTGQQMPLYPDIIADIRENRARLDMLGAASALACPYLIVHGDADITVPVSEARALAKAAGRNGRLEVIAGAGHTMGSVHPFLEAGPDLKRATTRTAEHFVKHLAGSE
ncbi:MAG: prolyl oligopeptidase family serine peptidase [Gemmatimonadota bacterium]